MIGLYYWVVQVLPENFDIKVDSKQVFLLILGVHNVLIKSNENGILKSRNGSQQRHGVLCEKGNEVYFTF